MQFATLYLQDSLVAILFTLLSNLSYFSWAGIKFFDFLILENVTVFKRAFTIISILCDELAMLQVN